MVITRAEQGGAQTHVFSLAKALLARGEDVRIGAGETGWLTERAAGIHAPTFTFRGLCRTWNPFYAPLFVSELYRHLIEYPADVVHLHSSNALLGTLAVRSVPKARRPKSVVTVHGLSVLSPGWRGNRAAAFAYRIAVRALWRLADHVIFVCRADRDFAVRHGLVGASRSSTVSNGIASDAECADRTEARKALGLSLDDARPVVGTVMRLQHAKDPDLFLDVAREFGERYRFVLVGDGPESARIARRVAEEGLVGTVQLVPGLRDACRLMRAFDAFLLPSRYEGSPYVVLEAALAGVPIAAANVGGVREVIENRRAGILVRDRSPQAFASALMYILERPAEAARMAAMAKARVLKMFGETRMADGILDIYRNVMRR